MSLSQTYLWKAPTPSIKFDSTQLHQTVLSRGTECFSNFIVMKKVSVTWMTSIGYKTRGLSFAENAANCGICLNMVSYGPDPGNKFSFREYIKNTSKHVVNVITWTGFFGGRYSLIVTGLLSRAFMDS